VHATELIVNTAILGHYLFDDRLQLRDGFTIPIEGSLRLACQQQQLTEVAINSPKAIG
jgi:hypothetical protein